MKTASSSKTNPASLLLRWYRKHGRDLPWRNTRSAYEILVSEIMLQQTQVSRVLEKYEAWLKMFPDWETLAKAGNADVIRAWAGLGYNRRGLALRDIAIQVVENGEPKTREEWQSLKGIGPYTSAAVSIFAQRERHIPIDTNVRRVLGRVLLGKPYPDASDDEEIERRATKLVSRIRAFYDVPQALFDLANAHCVKMPDCSACPLRTSCKTSSKFLSGNVRAPKRMIKKANETIREGKKHPDRIFRGRILKTVREATDPIRIGTVGYEVDPDYDPVRDIEWMEAMISRLAKDGLIEANDDKLSLPK